ncbi:hypothetical protein EIP86_004705 [Pleurotus ostreatoroseus]|nr:hypothetical protein EIP86_004705 [Pleurotus ostreatoroseus]
MSSDDEYYSAYDFPELTEEDYARIDATTRAALEPSRTTASTYSPANAYVNASRDVSNTSTRSSEPPGTSFGGPVIEIQIEPYTNKSAFKARRSNRKFSTSTFKRNNPGGLSGFHPPRSPYDEFRRRKKALSVTDLTGPAWCEVQFDYGLRQGRSKKLKDRPASFVTAEGNTITVDNSVAAVNDEIATKGTNVHKALEREIHPEELEVEVKTPQDRWALRQQKEDAQNNEKASAKPTATITDSNASGQTQITSFFPPSPSKSSLLANDEVGASSRPSFQLHLSDTKTRNRFAMPADEDTLSARLQLMLYFKLLSNLIVPASPFTVDFATVWTREGLSPTASLSAKFIQQAELDQLGVPEAEWNLSELVRIFRNSVEALNVEGVDPELTVEYRSQNKRGHTSKPYVADDPKGKGKERAFDEDFHMSSQLTNIEEAEVEDALMISSQDMSVSSQKPNELEMPSTVHTAGPSHSSFHSDFGASIMASEHWGSSPGPDDNDEVANDRQLQWAIEQSLRPPGANSTSDEMPSAEGVSEQTSAADENAEEKDTGEADEEDQTPAHEKWTIIGTKSFQYDEEFIDGYITSILEYWRGQRAPRGVEISLTRRCS